MSAGHPPSSDDFGYDGFLEEIHWLDDPQTFFLPPQPPARPAPPPALPALHLLLGSPVRHPTLRLEALPSADQAIVSFAYSSWDRTATTWRPLSVRNPLSYDTLPPPAVTSPSSSPPDAARPSPSANAASTPVALPTPRLTLPLLAPDPPSPVMPSARSRKRPAAGEASTESTTPATKRRRPATTPRARRKDSDPFDSASSNAKAIVADDPDGSIDLVDVEALPSPTPPTHLKKLADFTCCICMDSAKNVVITHCGHMYCSSCLNQALQTSLQNTICPMCRQKLDMRQTATQKKSTRWRGFFHLEFKLKPSSTSGFKEEDKNLHFAVANIVPNAHFRKDWQRFVKTWFDQPAQKERRRNARENRAKAIAPRPLRQLRPAVRGQTVKYNRKAREGRGFTKAELKEAKISLKAAQGLGISIDRRRRNASEEALAKNVQRLKAYKSKLVVFPRNPSSKKEKKGDASKEARDAAVQKLGAVNPVKTALPRFVARKISSTEKEAEVAKTLRTTLLHVKKWGIREKRAKDKAEAAKAPKKETLTDEADAE